MPVDRKEYMKKYYQNILKQKITKQTQFILTLPPDAVILPNGTIVFKKREDIVRNIHKTTRAGNSV